MKLSKSDSIEKIYGLQAGCDMTNSLERILRSYPHPYLTDVELESLLDSTGRADKANQERTANSRYSKVKRMLAQGKLLHIRRGLYCITKEMGYFKKPSSFELAQYIYGPSFISLESALSYYHLIPETVYTTTSAAGKRSKKFETDLGIFSYLKVPLDGLYTEVTLIKEQDEQFFIAKPWRAICDYVYCYRMDWNSIDPLIKSLRIELDDLPRLLKEDRQLLDDYYHQHRISRFLKGIQTDLNKLINNSEINDER